MATMPRLDVPSTMKKAGAWLVLPVGPASDGDSSKWRGPPYRALSNDAYRVKIGGLWAEQQGNGTKGINYYLDRLPRGYQLMDCPKPGDESVRYKRLFGHPSGRFYDSQLRFFPHFLWLMGGMKERCDCVLCNRGSAVAARSKESKTKFTSKSKTEIRTASEMARREAKTELGKRAKGVADYYDKALYENRADRPDRRTAASTEQAAPTDEQGTPDVFKELVQLLYRYRDSRKLIDERIEEKASPDWRAEHNDRYGDSARILNSRLTQIALQHSFVPRAGELVLWFRHHPDHLHLTYNPVVGGFQFYSPQRERFHGFPRWQAGVVTECPSTDPSIDFPDLLCQVNRSDSLNKAGFRVETFPDPNNDVDKSASKDYRYVPLRQIRPLNLWQSVLRAIPANRFDLSILSALTCMSSVSLLEKYRFVGKWPHGSIFCKGIYVGAELLIEGDAVKILPSHASSSVHAPECSDVLVIASIRLNLLDIDRDHTETTSPRLCGRSSISLVGKAYTLDPARGYDGNKGAWSDGGPRPIPTEQIKRILPTVGAAEYGRWYGLHAPAQMYEISFDRVLGRLHESGAVGMWTGRLANRAARNVPPSLSHDLASVLAGRRYGSATDERIPACPPGEVRWHWADNRVQALSLETVNGLEVGPYDPVRDDDTVRAWRARLKIIDGSTAPDDIKDSMLARQRGRPKGSRVVDGVVVGPDGHSIDHDTHHPPRGGLSGLSGLSEPIRPTKAVGGMVGAAQDDDRDERAKGDTESDSDDSSVRAPASKLSIMEAQKSRQEAHPTTTVNTTQTGLSTRGPTSLHTPNETRQGTGRGKMPSSLALSSTSSYVGRYDSSITPAMKGLPVGTVDIDTVDIDTVRTEGTGAGDTNSRWKGKEKARSPVIPSRHRTSTPSSTSETAKQLDLQLQPTKTPHQANRQERRDQEEGNSYPAPPFIKPESETDDDYRREEDEEDEEDGEDGEDEEDEDDKKDRDDGEDDGDESDEGGESDEARLRSLARFQMK